MASQNLKAKFRRRLTKELGIALVVLLPLMVGFVVLRVAVANSTEEMIQARRAFTEHTNIINRLITLRSQYDAFGKTYFNVLHNVIPEKDELINVSQEFQGVAAEHNLQFGFSFRGEDPASATSLGAVHFSIAVAGSNLPDITEFITDMQSFHYLTVIENLHVSRAETGMEAVIIGKVYYRTPEN
ncbi:hypothetical protein A2110_00625 [Candidatus Jorgensenbacteria bacterium GWA1_54_12]|uniref:Type 4 fimbrial biogenesis protein PilO n=1 Tax=Candidatus Jorgensenbacteria bacterium GWA1_54_12 TaxID=1798468 RepID=A0A1F6BL30_9BACT|nr:MAG: hypothetical protein A2110_00625 [Candidatus Jorgensenbacteria bacterium GWA1_54_12]